MDIFSGICKVARSHADDIIFSNSLDIWLWFCEMVKEKEIVNASFIMVS